MIPIGITTYNRAEYLDITLRSLSATKLSDDQAVIVFDDASDDPKTLKYLYSNDMVDLSREWPSSKQWYDIDLGIIKSRKNATGLKNKVPVVRLSNKRQRVVNASCDALRRLYKMFPNEDNVILLQDDVVFNVDWLDRLLDAYNTVVNPHPGIIAGMHIGNKYSHGGEKLVRHELTTAQCYFITPLGKKIVSEWINVHHNISTEFDNNMCTIVRKKETGMYLINPPVCQHIGISSDVRPSPDKPKHVDWKNVEWKRIDYMAHGPYVMAHNVKNFMYKNK